MKFSGKILVLLVGFMQRNLPFRQIPQFLHRLPGRRKRHRKADPIFRASEAARRRRIAAKHPIFRISASVHWLAVSLQLSGTTADMRVPVEMKNTSSVRRPAPEMHHS